MPDLQNGRAANILKDNSGQSINFVPNTKDEFYINKSATGASKLRIKAGIVGILNKPQA